MRREVLHCTALDSSVCGCLRVVVLASFLISAFGLNILSNDDERVHRRLQKGKLFKHNIKERLYVKRRCYIPHNSMSIDTPLCKTRCKCNNNVKGVRRWWVVVSGVCEAVDGCCWRVCACFWNRCGFFTLWELAKSYYRCESSSRYLRALQLQVILIPC
jgi:hypothetical protein